MQVYNTQTKLIAYMNYYYKQKQSWLIWVMHLWVIAK